MDFHNTLTSLDLVAALLTSQWGVIAVCSFILLWGLSALVTFQRRMGPIIQDLKQANRKLQSLPPDEREFASELAVLDEDVRRYPVLRHPWSEFYSTLIVDDDLQRPAVCNVHSPAGYFSRSAMLDNRVNLRFYNALPNLLTGAGILGTFVGLVAGIWLASSGLASQDVEAVRAALANLLNGASLAFTTSIVGLITSIVFSWREKAVLHRLERQRQDWVQGLEQRLRRLTPEQIARDTLRESRQQTEVLEQFTTDLAFQIAQAFEEKVASPMGPVLERLVAAVEGLREDQGRSNDDLLREVVEKFTQSISGAAGQEMTALAKTLAQLNERLGDQIGTLIEGQRRLEESSRTNIQKLTRTFQAGNEDFQRQVAQAVEALTGTLKEVVDEVSRTLRAAAQSTAQDLKSIAAVFGETTAGMRAGLQEVERITAESRQVMAQLEMLLASVHQTHDALRATGEPIRQAADQFGNAAQDIKSAAEQGTRTADQLRQAVAHLEALQGEVRQTWARYENRFDGLDQSLAKTFREMEEGLARYAETVRNYVAGLDNHTSSIVRDLAGAASDLSENIEDLRDALSQPVN